MASSQSLLLHIDSRLCDRGGKAESASRLLVVRIPQGNGQHPSICQASSLVRSAFMSPSTRLQAWPDWYAPFLLLVNTKYQRFSHRAGDYRIRPFSVSRPGALSFCCFLVPRTSTLCGLLLRCKVFSTGVTTTCDPKKQLRPSRWLPGQGLPKMPSEVFKRRPSVYRTCRVNIRFKIESKLSRWILQRLKS